MLLYSDVVMEFLKIHPEDKNQSWRQRYLYKNIPYDIIYSGEKQHHINVQP